MRPLQRVVEYLLWAAFAMIRQVFVLQALAFGAATGAAVLIYGGGWPDWVIRAAGLSAALSATLFVTALLLQAARRWQPSEVGADQHATQVWPVPFGLTLVLIAGLAVYAASPLTGLWSEILERLNGNIDWGDLSRPAPNAGLILLPILVGLMVPALVTLAALAAIALPLALLVLLPDRRPRFMALVGMSAVCQSGLAVASWLSARTLAGLVDTAAVLMRDSGDAEVLQVAEQLRQASDVLSQTALYLLAPAAGLVAWTLVLHPWRKP
jgi:hypothetical protein